MQTQTSKIDSANRRSWTVKHLGRQVYIETEDQNALTTFIADLRMPECTSEEERETALANAELIVRAVNSFDAMREALEGLLNTTELNAEELEGYTVEKLKKAQAALALASEEPRRG